jgi:hypothetical protein
MDLIASGSMDLIASGSMDLIASGSRGCDLAAAAAREISGGGGV